MNPEIVMHLPADSRFVATARVTTTSIAAELDYSVDDIEDLRTGVNELVSLVLERAQDLGADHLTVTWHVVDDGLEIEVVSDGEADGVDDDVLDALTVQILTAVVDSHEIGAGRGRIVKRRASA